MSSRGAEASLIGVPPEWQRDGQIIASRHIPGHGLCVVQRFIFSCGLMTKVRFDRSTGTCSYFARYCYELGSDAVEALLRFEGGPRADPPGPWIKEKITGRAGPGSQRSAVHLPA